MKSKTVIILLALVVLLGGAKFGYDALKKYEVQPQDTVSENKETETTKTEGETAKNNNEPAKAETLKAPNFTVRDIDGNHVEFSSLVGKPVVINFWATWCVYCRKEMPDFEEVYNEYKDKGVEFMLINATDNQSETRENVADYLKENNITIPVYFDEGITGVDGLTIEDSAQAVYGVASYPSTVFIDKEGNVAGAKIGLITKEALVQNVEKILN